MFRRTAALILIFSVVILGSAPVSAKKKRTSVPLTYFLNWQGDCAGGGFLSLESSDGSTCALYFNTQAEEHSFPAAEGLPLVLDAREQIPLDFELTTVYQVTAEFEATLTGSVKGERKTIATAAQTLEPQAGGSTSVHFDLEPDPSLQNAKFTDLNLSIALKSGYSYCTLDTGTGTLVVHGFK